MANEHEPIPMLERMPGFPYFYHDLVGRVTPGVIFLVLGYSWWPTELLSHFPPGELAEFATEHPVPFAAVFFPLFLGLAYAIGVVYEGLAFFWTRGVTRFVLRGWDFYTTGFRGALRDVRRREAGNLRITDPRAHDPGDVRVLARQAFTTFEVFELIVSPTYNRGTRFLAEAKMASYTASSFVLAFLGSMYFQGWRWDLFAVSASVASILGGPVAYARQRRRAIEVIAGIDYLRRGVNYPLAWK